MCTFLFQNGVLWAMGQVNYEICLFLCEHSWLAGPLSVRVSVCPDGSVPKICAKACHQKSCESDVWATCRTDPCDNCKVTFVDSDDNPVTCQGIVESPYNKGLSISRSQWWRHQMEKHFRVTGFLGGESIGHRWIPLTKASVDVFIDLRLNKRLMIIIIAYI